MQLKKYPVILFTSLFIIGIAFGKIIRLPEIYFGFYLLFQICIVLIYLVSGKNKFFNIITSYTIYIGLILTGIYYYSQEPPFTFRNMLHKEEVIFNGIITDINIGEDEEFRFTAISDSLHYGNSIIIYKGKFICVAAKDSGYNELLPGYKISLKGIYVRGRNIRNPGEFNNEEYLQKAGIAGYIYSYDETGMKILSRTEHIFSAATYRIRNYISIQLNFYFNKNTAALLRGFLLADRDDIDREVKTNFINSGTAHILAVSGLHVGYIVIIFLFLSGRLNLYLRSMITILGLAAFVIITGAPDSVIRAALMAIILIIAFISNRSTNIYNSLFLSALVILIFNPGDLFLPGFQLSYVAVLSIAFIYPYFHEKINNWNINNQMVKRVLLFVSVSLAAQIGTLPFVLFYFSKLSLTSVIANLFVIPAAGLLIGTSFFVLIIGPLSGTLAFILASSSDLLSSIVFYFTDISGDPLYSFVWVNNFSVNDLIIFYLVLAAYYIFIEQMNRVLNKVILTIITFFIIVMYISIDDKEILKDNILNCYMIDVGQGDAFLLKFPTGKTALIDAGETRINYDTGERVIEPLLNYFGIEQVDYAFVSHLDNDHYSGFVHLINKGYIKYLYKPIPDTTEKDLKFEKYLKEKNINYTYYNGDIISLEGARVYVLDNSTFTDERQSGNDLSGVIMMKYGDISLLFTGDAGKRVENYYIQRYDKFLKTDVLKVSHHGSTSASSEEFLYITRPSIALISAGEKNKYGHPSKIVLEALENINANIYRTDQEGGILLQSDGNSIKKVNWKEI